MNGHRAEQPLKIMTMYGRVMDYGLCGSTQGYKGMGRAESRPRLNMSGRAPRPPLSKLVHPDGAGSAGGIT